MPRRLFVTQQSSDASLFPSNGHPCGKVLCYVVVPSIKMLPHHDPRGFKYQAIKKWHTSFKEYGPSDELNELFAKSAEVLGSMLGELNTRIQVCCLLWYAAV